MADDREIIENSMIGDGPNAGQLLRPGPLPGPGGDGPGANGDLNEQIPFEDNHDLNILNRNLANIEANRMNGAYDGNNIEDNIGQILNEIINVHPEERDEMINVDRNQSPRDGQIDEDEVTEANDAEEANHHQLEQADDDNEMPYFDLNYIYNLDYNENVNVNVNNLVDFNAMIENQANVDLNMHLDTNNFVMNDENNFVFVEEGNVNLNLDNFNNNEFYEIYANSINANFLQNELLSLNNIFFLNADHHHHHGNGARVGDTDRSHMQATVIKRLRQITAFKQLCLVLRWYPNCMHLFMQFFDELYHEFAQDLRNNYRDFQDLINEYVYPLNSDDRSLPGPICGSTQGFIQDRSMVSIVRNICIAITNAIRELDGKTVVDCMDKSNENNYLSRAERLNSIDENFFEELEAEMNEEEDDESIEVEDVEADDYEDADTDIYEDCYRSFPNDSYLINENLNINIRYGEGHLQDTCYENQVNQAYEKIGDNHLLRHDHTLEALLNPLQNSRLGNFECENHHHNHHPCEHSSNQFCWDNPCECYMKQQEKVACGLSNTSHLFSTRVEELDNPFQRNAFDCLWDDHNPYDKTTLLKQQNGSCDFNTSRRLTSPGPNEIDNSFCHKEQQQQQNVMQNCWENSYQNVSCTFLNSSETSLEVEINDCGSYTKVDSKIFGFKRTTNLLGSSPISLMETSNDDDHGFYTSDYSTNQYFEDTNRFLESTNNCFVNRETRFTLQNTPPTYIHTTIPEYQNQFNSVAVSGTLNMTSSLLMNVPTPKECPLSGNKKTYNNSPCSRGGGGGGGVGVGGNSNSCNNNHNNVSSQTYGNLNSDFGEALSNNVNSLGQFMTSSSPMESVRDLSFIMCANNDPDIVESLNRSSSSTDLPSHSGVRQTNSTNVMNSSNSAVFYSHPSSSNSTVIGSSSGVYSHSTSDAHLGAPSTSSSRPRSSELCLSARSQQKALSSDNDLPDEIDEDIDLIDEGQDSSGSNDEFDAMDVFNTPGVDVAASIQKLLEEASSSEEARLFESTFNYEHARNLSPLSFYAGTSFSSCQDDDLLKAPANSPTSISASVAASLTDNSLPQMETWSSIAASAEIRATFPVRFSQPAPLSPQHSMNVRNEISFLANTNHAPSFVAASQNSMSFSMATEFNINNIYPMAPPSEAMPSTASFPPLDSVPPPYYLRPPLEHQMQNFKQQQHHHHQQETHENSHHQEDYNQRIQQPLHPPLPHPIERPPVDLYHNLLSSPLDTDNNTSNNRANVNEINDDVANSDQPEFPDMSVLTTLDHSTISRLSEMGFPEAMATQAYYAFQCDKNSATNFLLYYFPDG